MKTTVICDWPKKNSNIGIIADDILKEFLLASISTLLFGAQRVVLPCSSSKEANQIAALRTIETQGSVVIPNRWHDNRSTCVT